MKLQTKAVALALDLSTDRVRKLEQEGKIKAEKTASGTRLFDAKDVEKFARERAANKGKKR